MLLLKTGYPRRRIYALSRLTFTAIFLLCLAVWASSFSGAFAKQQPPNETYINLLTKRVSIIQLIATPERFDGKQVFVDGILHHVFEDDTLYGL